MRVMIYDMNNYARIKCEQTWGQSWIRSICDEACKDDGYLRIFVFDGPHGNDYRKAFYPNYKANRKPPLIDTFFENLDFLEELLGLTSENNIVVRMKGIEADDIIADLCEKFENPIVLSTDKDLLAIQNADLPLANKDWEDRRFIQIKKMFVGDPSDSITGVKGFGEGAWKKISEGTKLKIKEWCDADFDDSMKFNIVHRLIGECGTRGGNALANTPREEMLMWKKVISFRKDLTDLKLRWCERKRDEMNRRLEEFML